MILQSENPIRMVRELKGAPLSIVMVLSLVTQRVNQEYLECYTGYTDKPVSQALAYLREVGLADHTSAGWQLIKENARQLPLMKEIEEGTPPQPSLSQSELFGMQFSQNENGEGDNTPENRNNSDSLLT